MLNLLYRTCNSQVKYEYDRDYFLRGIKLQRVAVEKDLGILVSQDSIWDNQVDVLRIYEL